MAITLRNKIWHYAFMIDGERFRGSTKEHTKTKAAQFEALRMAEVRNSGGNVNLKRAPFLCDFVRRYLKYVDDRAKAGQLEEKTRKCYHNGWRLLSATDIAGMRIDQITTSDAEVLRFPGGPSNGNQALRTLRRILSYACEVGILRAAPRIKLFEEHGREALIEPWVESLLMEFSPQYLADAITIMLDCGMRPEEVVRMLWENIFWDRGVILVPYGKTHKSKRFVGMTDRMRTLLLAAQEGSKSSWVFPTKRKKTKTGHRVNLTKIWGETLDAAKSAAKDRGLPEIPSGLVLYSARHTFATNFLESGGDLAKLKHLLGHASITTTEKYLHPSTANAAEVMNRHNRNKGLKLVKSAKPGAGNFELPQNLPQTLVAENQNNDVSLIGA